MGRVRFFFVGPVGRNDTRDGYAAYKELTMKSYWRVLFAGLIYLAYAGQARCEEYGSAQPAQYQGAAAWQTEQPSRGLGEYRLVNGEADLDAPAGGALQSPVQVGKGDLKPRHDCCPA